MTMLALLLAAATAIPPGAHVTRVANADEKRAIVVDLDKRLARTHGAAIAHCAEIYDYAVPSPLGGDTSFGAVCTLTSGNQVTMCDDRMVGKFAYTDRVLHGPGEVGTFIAEHCPPSG